MGLLRSPGVCRVLLRCYMLPTGGLRAVTAVARAFCPGIAVGGSATLLCPLALVGRLVGRAKDKDAHNNR
jgi:hypothetical protein